MHLATTDFFHCFLGLLYTRILRELKRFVRPGPADFQPATHDLPTRARPAVFSSQICTVCLKTTKNSWNVFHR